MATDEAAKREKQSKALGAAFLAHQVSELERSVDTLTFSRSNRGSNTARGGGGSSRSRGGGAAPRSGSGGITIKPIRIVDASTLIHALPVLKRWVRQDEFQLVVPLSALATLDILKKSPPPLHDQAREATRFLETQFSIARQIQSSFSSNPSSSSNSRIRLRAQANTEELSWSQVEKLFRVPEGYIVELPTDENTGEPIELPPPEEGQDPFPLPLPTANDIPRSLRSTLQCVLYFYSSKPPSPNPTPPSVAIYNSDIPVPAPIPSSLLSLIPPPTSTSSSSPRKPHHHSIDFLSLSSGDLLSYYLETFFPHVILNPTNNSTEAETGSIKKISKEEVEAAREWAKKLAASQLAQREKSERSGTMGNRGNGSSRGGGSRGRGGGNGTGGRRVEGQGKSSLEGPARTLFVP
ncbi:hypothetical protein JCM16303_001953 [Sporobolomyces ruberrimus]